MMSWRIVILLIAVSISKSSCDQIEDVQQYNFWKYWKPSHYSVEIALNIEEESFSGEVRITGTILEDTDKLGLHSKVNISQGFYSIKEKTTELDLNLSLENETLGVIVFMLDQIISKDVELVLTLKFTGQMQEIKGLYMSFYEVNNEKIRVISTELEPMQAQMVFPCVDIPSYKAVFELKLGRPQSMKSLANMPLKSTSAPDPNINGQVWDTFYPTPKMSTYLVAIAVFDELSSKELQYNNTIWFAEENKDTLPLFETMVLLLKAMENYTGINYNLPKLDLLVVPSKEPAAMESWGLITWNSKLLYSKSETTYFLEEFDFIISLAHELAHQWFGNLVTCKYWCYLWLNEGITSYLMHLIVDQVFPESKAMELFMILNTEIIMISEENKPFPLVSKEHCTNEISQYKLSSNTYLKGAAITSMIARVVMNSDAFRQGLQHYLSKNQFDSVVEHNLWESLQTKIDNRTLPDGESLESVMYGWTHNKGFPLLTVNRHDNGTLTVKQEPLYRTIEDVDFDTYWWVPLSYTTSKERDFENVGIKEWLRPTNNSQPLAITITDEEWIMLNIQSTGYFRVNYDERTWELITAHLMGENMTLIHPLNRARIIKDAFVLAQSGFLNYTTALNLSRYLKNELHFIPLYSGLSAIKEIKDKYLGTPAYDILKEYYKYIIANVYNHVVSRDFQVNNLVNYLAKMTIIQFGCAFKFEHCKNQTEEILNALMNNEMDTKQLNPTLRSTFWCSASSIGDEKVFEFIKRKYIEEKQVVIKNDYFNALFCVRKKELVKRVLKDIFNEADYLKEGETTDMIIDLFSYDTSCNTIDYYFDHFDDISLRFGNESLLDQLTDLNKASSVMRKCDQKMKKLLTEKSIDVPVNWKIDWDDKFIAEIKSWYESIDINVESPYAEEENNIIATNIFVKDNTNFFSTTNLESA